MIRTLTALFRTATPPDALFAATTSTAAERLLHDWRDQPCPLVRDPLFRETMARSAVRAEQTGPGWIWRFDDGSVLTATEAGVWVR